MDDDSLVAFIETYVYPAYVTGWVPIKRTVLLPKRFGQIRIDWQHDTPIKACVEIDHSVRGRDLLFVALHEIGHLCLHREYADVGHAFGMDVLPRVERYDASEEEALNRWATQEADKWWPRIQQAKRSKTDWREFLRQLEEKQ